MYIRFIFTEKLHSATIDELEGLWQDWQETHKSTCEVVWSLSACHLNVVTVTLAANHISSSFFYLSVS